MILSDDFLYLENKAIHTMKAVYFTVHLMLSFIHHHLCNAYNNSLGIQDTNKYQ